MTLSELSDTAFHLMERVSPHAETGIVELGPLNGEAFATRTITEDAQARKEADKSIAEAEGHLEALEEELELIRGELEDAGGNEETVEKLESLGEMLKKARNALSP